MENGKINNSLRLKLTTIFYALMFIFIAELLFYTWCSVQCTRLGYEIDREAIKYRQNTVLQKNLKIELARLKSPERISKIAKEYLGLVVPAPEQVINIP